VSPLQPARSTVSFSLFPVLEDGNFSIPHVATAALSYGSVGSYFSLFGRNHYFLFFSVGTYENENIVKRIFDQLAYHCGSPKPAMCLDDLGAHSSA